MKETEGEKDPEGGKQVCCFYERSDVDPEPSVQLDVFQSHLKFLSRINLDETMRRFVQRALQCASCCTDAEFSFSFTHLLTAAFPACPS